MIATLEPEFANPFAIPSPIPPLPPVTIETLSFKLNTLFSYSNK